MAVIRIRKNPPEGRHDSGCLLCGSPLVYSTAAEERVCAVCGEKHLSNCACEKGHYVCDRCHAAGLEAEFIPLLLRSREKDPQKLLEAVFALPGVHMHGPEHHAVVPCVLLTAYRNCGGELDLRTALGEALKRGRQVPGGTCGYWGVCGAAAGAGIYFSILTRSTPLAGEVWDLPQRLAARCLNAIADAGGPRCCKRTARLAVREAVRYTTERLGPTMPETQPVCGYVRKNRECIGERCPYYPH